MISGFRICKRKYASQAFTGQGAAEYPGRWNLLSFPVVYCAENTALACLEIYTHLSTRQKIDSHVIFSIQIPEALVATVVESDLPKGWNAKNFGRISQRFGTEWLQSMRSVALKVPSVLVPNDYNVLLNPNHPEFSQIQINPPKPFRFHPNLAKHIRKPR